MNISIWLMAASCLAGGAGQNATVYSTPAAIETPQIISTTNVVYPEAKPGLFSGLRQMLSQRRFERSLQTSYTMPPGAIVQTSYVPQAAVPTASAPTNQEPPIQPVAAQQLETPLKKYYRDKVGCSEDYQWITGQLFHLHMNGGVWVVRYASVGEEDRYGGSVVLAPAVNMKNYREGDLVCIHGEVLNQGRATPRLGGPLYRVDNIDLVERAN